MKSTRHIQLLAAVSLALTILPAIEAERRCPGNTASVTPRFVQHALIVIPVRINQSGPFDFMVDTGSQVTVIDPSLAAELNLRPQGRVGLVSVASVAQASVTDMRIGTRTLDHVYFVTPVSVEQNIPTMETDGLLPTVLFQRIFISAGGHYVIFEPK